MKMGMSVWLSLAVVMVVGVSALAAMAVTSASDGLRTAPCDRPHSYGEDPNEPCDRSGRGGLSQGQSQERASHVDAYDVLAELLGTDRAGLRAALASGQSLAQIAEANGVELQPVIDWFVARLKARFDAAVASGRLSETVAAVLLAELEAKIVDYVHNGSEANQSRSSKRLRR